MFQKKIFLAAGIIVAAFIAAGLGSRLVVKADNPDLTSCNGNFQTYYRDVDGDNFGIATSTILACSQPDGYAATSTDCNDANAQIYPSAPELCNGIDDNCNGIIDEGCATLTFYRDADSDSYGYAASSTQATSQPSGYVANSTDCNDANAQIHPGTQELCNGIDDNCNGVVDEGVKSTFYLDADGDNYGRLASTTLACSAPSDYVTNSTDCNDTAAAIHPGATETCNGIDDNCNGTIDEGCATSTYYRDADEDSYGNAASSTQATSQPNGYVTNSSDCNDSNDQIHPGATELCNGIDDNCDGVIDEGVKLTFYHDADSDSYGNLASTTLACSAPTGYVAISTDCNDLNANVHPGVIELCNGIDDNCNGIIDEGCSQNNTTSCLNCCLQCIANCFCQNNQNEDTACHTCSSSGNQGAIVSCMAHYNNLIRKIGKIISKEDMKIAKEVKKQARKNIDEAKHNNEHGEDEKD